METIRKGKQTNKQTSRGSMCRGVDAGGSAELHSMWSLIHNASEYVEELQRCFRDALEMHWKSMEFNTQGCTLTIGWTLKPFFYCAHGCRLLVALCWAS